MNAPTTNAIAATTAETRGISRLVRRIHMFTGLFLAPWMVMYALSTLVMAHQEYVNSFYGSKSPVMVKERELDYSRSFPTNLTRDAIAQTILNDLSMDGAHSVSGGRNGGPLVIQRQHAMPQRRLTFDASTSKITIEREEFRTPTVLERLHRRRGYNHPYALEDTWGFTVDVACAGIIIWVASGLIMWWRLPRLRTWGAIAVGGGILSFALLVWTL